MSTHPGKKMEKKAVKTKLPPQKVQFKRTPKLSSAARSFTSTSSSDDDSEKEGTKTPRFKETQKRKGPIKRTVKQTDTKHMKSRGTNTTKSKPSRLKDKHLQDTDSDIERHSVDDSQSDDEIFFALRGEMGERLLQSLETNFDLKFATELCDSFEKTKDDDKMKSHFNEILAQNFRTIVESDDFVQTNVDFVEYLLDLDDVNIQSEVEIFNAALKWLTFNKRQRRTFANVIIGKVRFYLMDEEDYMKCITQTDHEFDLRDIVIGQEALLPSKNYKLSKKTGHFPIRNRTALLKNRKRHSLTETKFPENSEPEHTTNNVDHSDWNVDIICVAGFNPAKHANKNENDCKIYGFKPDKSEWFPIGRIKKTRHYFAATVCNGFIYLSGGFDPSLSNDNLLKDDSVNFVVKDTFWKIDPTKKFTWEILQPMKYARAHHVLVAASGQIYAIGGQDGRGMPLDSVERYDPRSGNWEQASPLLSPCLGMAACEHEGAIWMCGGIVASNQNSVRRHGQIVDTVYIYNPSNNLWHFGIPLRFPRAFSNLLVFEGSLHIVGGVTAVRDFSDGKVEDVFAIDQFYPTTKNWKLMSDLATARHSSASIAIGSRLYVIGGVASGEATNSGECYDSSIGQWLPNIQPFETPVSGFACVEIPTTL